MLHRSIRTILLIILGVATAHGATYDIPSSLGDLSTQLDLLTGQLLTFSKDITGSVPKGLDPESEKIAQASLNATITKASLLQEARKKMQFSLVKNTAVIVVDVQRDFVDQPFGSQKAGSLAVKDTKEAYTKAAEKFVDTLRHEGYLIVFTADNHPQGHVSFKSRWDKQTKVPVTEVVKNVLYSIKSPYTKRVQMVWPDHCVQVTPGVSIAINFDKNKDLKVSKGMHLNFDSYSGFVDDGGTKTAMEAALNILGITNLIVIGVATDYCVQATVLDALKLKKYNVYVIINLCRGVTADTSTAALNKMQAEGAKLVLLEDIFSTVFMKFITKGTLPLTKINTKSIGTMLKAGEEQGMAAPGSATAFYQYMAARS